MKITLGELLVFMFLAMLLYWYPVFIGRVLAVVIAILGTLVILKLVWVEVHKWCLKF
jgi:hypothetical protein